MRILAAWLVLGSSWLAAGEGSPPPSINVETCIFEVNTARLSVAHPNLHKGLKALDAKSADAILERRMLEPGILVLDKSRLSSLLGRPSGGTSVRQGEIDRESVPWGKTATPLASTETRIESLVRRAANSPDRIDLSLKIEMLRQLPRPKGEPERKEVDLSLQQDLNLKLGETQIVNITPARAAPWKKRYLRVHVEPTRGEITPASFVRDGVRPPHRFIEAPPLYRGSKPIPPDAAPLPEHLAVPR
jgi:hypothetical protein